MNVVVLLLCRSPPDKSQLSLPGLGQPEELLVNPEVITPCTPGDPLSHLHHKNKVTTTVYSTELGTRHNCSDNLTTFSGQTIVTCHITAKNTFFF